MKKVARMCQHKAYALAETARTIAYHYIDYLWLLAILCRIFSLGICNELVIEFVLHKVDSATAEAATHNTASGNAVLASDVVEEVEFFT